MEAGTSQGNSSGGSEEGDSTSGKQGHLFSHPYFAALIKPQARCLQC